MTATAHGRVAPFDLGRVVARSFAFCGSRWLALLVLALVFSVIAGTPLALTRLMPVAPTDPGWRSVTTAALTFRSLADLTLRALVLAMALAWPARRVSLGEACVACLRAAPALAPWWLAELVPSVVAIWIPNGTNIGTRLAVTWTVFGVTYLFAFALALTIGVYSAVVLAERRGFWPSLRRAATLMAGGRWKFFLMYLGFELVVFVIGFITGFAAALSYRTDPAHAHAWVVAAPALGGGLARLAYPLWSAITAMSYRELTRVHAGVEPDDVAHVFA